MTRPQKLCFYFLTVIFVIIGLAVPSQAQVVRTGFASIVTASTGKCLDISGASNAPGAVAVQWHCSNSANEAWTVQPYNGYFRIIERQTGQCLVVTGGSTSVGAQLSQNNCTGGNSELWSLVPSGNYFEIVNRNSGQCANVNGASIVDAANIVQGPCSTQANFLWSVGSGLLTSSVLSDLQAGHSGQCLNVNGNSTAAGANVIQYPCSGGANEQWSFVPSGSSYELISQHSGLCLAVAGGSTAQNSNIVQSACNGASSSLWKLNPVGGAYQLIAQNSGLCATVSGASQNPATQVTQTACSTAQDELWSLSTATLQSNWTGVISLSVDPVGIANLPSGQILMWSANQQLSFQGDIGNSANGQTYTGLFDPNSGTSSETVVTNTGADMFCPGTGNLFDGRILVNGGDSSPKTSLYNPFSNSWASDANMKIPRGYEGNTVLTNGSLLTLGGSWSGGHGNKNGEVWTSGSGWRELSGVPASPITGPDPAGVYRGDNHLWLFDAPNGEVFHAGPSAQMHWITTTGNGSITSAGNRGDDPYAMTGDAVLYDVGLIMKAGGSPAYQDANAEAAAYTININNGTAGVYVNKIAPMAYPRAFANGVVLPNGEVVIMGGQTYPVPFSDATAILVPEIWDPATQVFRQLKPEQTSRVYHSTGILLQDGRVFSGGGGLCGSGCSTNHLNAEILTPPYLLNADGSAANRPVITGAPTTGSVGGTLSVTTATPVVSFALMRLSSTTHTVNNDQRRVPLQMQTTNGTSYVLSVPNNTGIVLPGYYWLFALSNQGVPSVGAVIQIQ